MSMKFGLLIGFIALRPSVAQDVRVANALADSSPRRIMAHVGHRPDADWLSQIMRQETRHQSRVVLEELQDSLAHRALLQQAPRSTDPQGYDEALRSVAALAYAGKTSIARGTPAPGVFDRLLRIHKQARQQGIRRAALSSMFALREHDRVLAYVRDVAVSDDSTALAAMQYLINEASGERWVGRRPSYAEQRSASVLLLSLYEKRLVRQSAAASLLELWANQRH